MQINLKASNIDRILNRVNPKVADRVARMALNKAVPQGKTEASKKIRERYNIKAADVREKIILRKAFGNNLKVVITVIGRPLSLTYFGAMWAHAKGRTTRKGIQLKSEMTDRQKKALEKQSGVYYEAIKGKKKHKPHAFIATVKTKKEGIVHIGVFERTGKGRLPIVERKLITIPSMFSRTEVKEATLNKISKVFTSEFKLQAQRLMNK